MRDITLITGGAGFIGCELATALGFREWPTIAVDVLLTQVHPKQERPDALPRHVELVVADVRDGQFWRKFFETHRPREVVHFAAETGTGQSLTESARHASVNVTGTAEMLDAINAAGHRPDHMLLSSSRAVYGEGAWQSEDGRVFYPGGRTHDQLAQAQWSFVGPDGISAKPMSHRADTVHPQPVSVYGATKLAQENIMAAWASATNVPLSILRFQNVYGPGQSPYNPYTGIITLFHRQARADKVIDVYEDGEIGRDFVFISDVVAACKAALERPPHGVRILDVGFGQATTIHEAASIIAASHRAPPPRISGKFRDGDVRWAVSDADPLFRELKVRASVGFVEGSRRVSDWLIANGHI